MPIVLKSYKAALDDEHLMQSAFDNICSDIASALLQALNKEPSNKFLFLNLDSLEECMKMSGPILNENQIQRFLDMTMKVVRACSSLSGSREDLEQGEKVSNKFVQSLITVMKTHDSFSTKFFDQLQSWMSQMWDKDKTVKEQKATLQIFSNTAKQFGENAFKYLESSLPSLFKACTNENPEIQQVVAQAIGFSAEFGGSIFLRHAKEARDSLREIITSTVESRENYTAYAAAVSAFGKIYFFHPDLITTVADLDFWLSHLPIKRCVEEAKVSNDQFCSTVSKLAGRFEYFRHNETRLSRIMSTFAEILLSVADVATEESVRKVGVFKEREPPHTWNSVLSSLESSLQNHLKRCLPSN